MPAKSKPKKSFRSGFVAILGRPNAGKSTLLNRLVGQKIAIVTSKPQTTRNRVQGIVNRPNGQIVFIDTPGLHESSTLLNRQMMREVAAAVEGIDVLLLVVDATHEMATKDSLIVQKAKAFMGHTILVLNKVDRLPKPKLLPMIESFQAQHSFSAIVPISALKGVGVDDLIRSTIELLPEGEAYFPPDQVTDQPERFLASEIIREKAIDLTYHEVPHALAVYVDKYEETPRLLRIEATLHVERDSQKKILVGHKGEMLKKIGTLARKEMEELFGMKIFLGLFVKVVPEWREDLRKIRDLDWHSQLEALSEDQRRRAAAAAGRDPDSSEEEFDDLEETDDDESEADESDE